VSDLDELAEAARNRGLKLVHSRVRTPTKRRFGKVGLTDKAGKPVFGMDAKGPVAKPEQVEEYLRTLDAEDWGASLHADGTRKDKAERPVPRTARSSPREPKLAAAKAKPKAKSPKPKPEPKPQIRAAKPKDVPRIVELIHYLGHEIDAKTLRKNFRSISPDQDTVLVAAEGTSVLGLVGVQKRFTILREGPIGRISPLVVDEQAQGRGIGRMLVHAAEALCRDRGCKLVEVTSNDRRAEAHAFYRQMGYERSSIRFVKKL
jgi:ribosomal protein S18 acetylase RimI-like enzyme